MYLYNTLSFLASFLFKLLFKLKVEGVENIPKEGRVVLCSNHINILDPILLASVIDRPIVFMAKKELFENRFLNSLIRKLGAFPVDREGSSLSSVKTSLRTLKEGKILGIFPEGTRVKEVNLDNAKPGVSLISIRSKSPIIPIYIESKYRLFSEIKVSIRKPISFEEFYDKKLSTEDYKNISKDIMKAIYGLK